MMLEFTITCNDCDGTNVSLWHRSSGGEDVGVVFKCRDCGNEDGPF
jgi:DNA-directed RNA polymerase subunit M/transcription elongation factor TFIIS